jgi:hypothetical protein
MRTARVIAATACILALAGSASAVVISTADGAGADAYVRNGGSANHNFGADPELLVKTSHSAGWHRSAYLRFDLSDYAGQTITDATLALSQLTGSGTSPSGTQWQFGVFGISESADDWAEGVGTLAAPGASGIRSSSQPAGAFSATNGVIPVSGSLPLLATFSITGSSTLGSVSIASSTALADFIAADADGIVSLGIYRFTTEQAGGGTAYHAFASAEHGSVAAPTLSFQTVPAPGGIALVAMAGGILLTRRRVRADRVSRVSLA